MDVAGEVVAVGAGGRRRRRSASASSSTRRSRTSPTARGSPAAAISTGTWRSSAAPVDGGYAELCLAPASHVYRVPDSMPLHEGGHVPDLLAHGLARAVRDRRGSLPGETLLVHAAGSGVSVAAIQLARWKGARRAGDRGHRRQVREGGRPRRRRRAEQPHRPTSPRGPASRPTASASTSSSTTWVRRCSPPRSTHCGPGAGWSTPATRRATRPSSRRSATCSTWA